MVARRPRRRVPGPLLGTSALAASSLASIWTGASALLTLCGQAWGANSGNLTGIWLQMGLVVTSVFIWY
ncbi:unnamed protein product [Globisporangium polare]